MLPIVVICLHRVQDGVGAPLAEGALELALSPPQDAFIAEAVEEWHRVAGVFVAAQADRAALLQLRGHALHWLRWAGGSWG